jgi:SulP family sulfate permease
VGMLVFPGVVIALVGSPSRRRSPADTPPPTGHHGTPEREFIGQGLANVAAGLFNGYPAGGSFPRSALNRLSGARTRWSGAITGLVVLTLLPAAGTLAALPKAVLAGLVIAAALSLIEIRPFVECWRYSRPQFVVAVATFAVTLAAAPRVERGVVTGVVLSLAVHVWREMRLDIDASVDGTTLHVRLYGVLYFGSAPAFVERVAVLLAAHRDVRNAVLHLEGLGRLDLTGLFALRALIEQARCAGMEVQLRGVPSHSTERIQQVLGQRCGAPAELKMAASGGLAPGPGR